MWGQTSFLLQRMCECGYFHELVSFTYRHWHLEAVEGSSESRQYTWRDAISIPSPKLDAPAAHYKVPVILCLLDLGVFGEMPDENQFRQVCTAWGSGGKRLYRSNYFLFSSMKFLVNSRGLTSGWRRYEEDQAYRSLRVGSYGSNSMSATYVLVWFQSLSCRDTEISETSTSEARIASFKAGINF